MRADDLLLRIAHHCILQFTTYRENDVRVIEGLRLCAIIAIKRCIPIDTWYAHELEEALRQIEEDELANMLHASFFPSPPPPNLDENLLPSQEASPAGRWFPWPVRRA